MTYGPNLPPAVGIVQLADDVAGDHMDLSQQQSSSKREGVTMCLLAMQTDVTTAYSCLTRKTRGQLHSDAKGCTCIPTFCSLIAPGPTNHLANCPRSTPFQSPAVSSCTTISMSDTVLCPAAQHLIYLLRNHLWTPCCTKPTRQLLLTYSQPLLKNTSYMFTSHQ